MNWVHGLLSMGDFIVGIVIGLLTIVAVKEISLRLSAYIQWYIQSNGIFAERLDSGISMAMFGFLLLASILIGGFNIKLNSINDPHLPTIGVIVGAISILLGAAETIYLVKFKIPKFKSKYDTNT